MEKKRHGSCIIISPGFEVFVEGLKLFQQTREIDTGDVQSFDGKAMRIDLRDTDGLAVLH